ncbi:hypothetical protein SYK_07060 [Pseudodesulfovibrio nedwellii]|uniref:Uncharacterized protein n=1 Tax=Pseudodesulfovibrio nedwellii TaxID=2973072 RepID=A0ABM8AXV2_9BACT|nr:hypothetical protein SYK_07060 [Pseudodesulfovibrio nedwellii]
MKITKTENGYILEDPQTSNEEQALERFVESLREGNEIVETSSPSSGCSATRSPSSAQSQPKGDEER